MARKMSFGRILRDARHKKHMDITTAAARLRIRSDILQSIEDEDFSRMPPHGYTRNMIGAYARLLGLNGSDITRLYLDEAYAIEVGKARNDTARTRSSARSRSRNASQDGGRGRRSDHQSRPVRHNANGRAVYDDREDRSPRTYTTDRVHPTQHAPMPAGHYTNFYAGPKNSPLSGKLPFVIAGVIILIVIIIILVIVLRPSGEATQELPNVPIAGVTDTSDTESNEPPEPVPPTQATFTYEIDDNRSVYLEIYVDGESTPVEAGVVEGPESATYDVTGSLLFVTASPDYVTIKVDGEDVKLTDEDGDGVYEYTVDFASVLNQWLKDHGQSSDSKDDGDTSDADDGDASSTSSGSSSSASSSRSSSSSSDSGTKSSSGSDSSSDASA